MSNITEDAKIQFDDEVKEEKKPTIDDEINNILKSADALISVLEKIIPQINSDKILNEEAFLKVIKPLCVDVENSLPLLMEYEDNLEYIKDDKAYELKAKISHLEDDLLPPLIQYINEHDKKK